MEKQIHPLIKDLEAFKNSEPNAFHPLIDKIIFIVKQGVLWKEKDPVSEIPNTIVPGVQFEREELKCALLSVIINSIDHRFLSESQDLDLKKEAKFMANEIMKIEDNPLSWCVLKLLNLICWESVEIYIKRHPCRCHACHKRNDLT
jgi:hypothetical protein